MERNNALEFVSKSPTQNLTGFAKRHDIHWARKIWHISTGSLGIAFYLGLDLPAQPVAIGCIITAVFFWLFDTIRFQSPQLNAVFCRVTKPILRTSEIHHYGGHSFYLLGIGLSLLLFNEKIAILSILFLVFADPLSSLVGGIYGKEKILPNKSLEGSLTCFIVCYTLAFFYMKILGVTNSHLVLFCLAGGVFGALSELISAFKIDDNLTIPVVSGLGLTVFNNLLNVL